MKVLWSGFLAASIFLFAGCRMQLGGGLDWAALPQAWHEDNARRADDVQTFVPAAVPVPRARFVEAMTFAPDGTFAILRLAPDDAHYWAHGAWTRRGGIVTVMYYDDSLIHERYQIVELTRDVFRFRRL